MKKYSELTDRDMSDSGQAFALICLILALFAGGKFWLWLGVLALVANMAKPSLFKWFALVWLNLSQALAKIVPPVIMTLEFFLLVLPIGLVRRAMGKDAMAMKKWKQGEESVFVTRDHVYVADDLKNPY